jgi:hypothetical protein
MDIWRRAEGRGAEGGWEASSELALIRRAAAFEDQTRLALEGNEESGVGWLSMFTVPSMSGGGRLPGCREEVHQNSVPVNLARSGDCTREEGIGQQNYFSDDPRAL